MPEDEANLTEPTSWRCPLCGLLSDSRDNARTHMIACAEPEPMTCPTCGLTTVGNEHGALMHMIACEERAAIHRLERALESDPSEDELREAVEAMLALDCSANDLRVLVERVRALNQVFAQDERIERNCSTAIGALFDPSPGPVAWDEPMAVVSKRELLDLLVTSVKRLLVMVPTRGKRDCECEHCQELREIRSDIDRCLSEMQPAQQVAQLA